MKVVGIYNIKGGVGKTSTAVNLAHLAARAEYATLLWDLDAQGAASFYLRVRPEVAGGGRKLLRGKTPIAKAIQESEFGLDVLPADFSYRKLDLILDQMGKAKKRFRDLLEPLSDDYDVVFLDCPPSISKLTDAILGAADVVIAPTIPTILSMRTLADIIRYVKKRFRNKVELRAFFCMMDRRRTLHRDIHEQSLARPHLFLKTCIPYASTVEQMGVRRAPVCQFASSSTAGKAYIDLWGEVEELLFSEESR